MNTTPGTCGNVLQSVLKQPLNPAGAGKGDMNNGIPFAGEGLLGLSCLSGWWMNPGIRVYFIEPSKPYQNGHLERLHGTLKIEATPCFDQLELAAAPIRSLAKVLQ
jgi:hypothetical protein